MRRALAIAALMALSAPARAGDFDANGRHQPAPNAVLFESFEQVAAAKCEEGCSVEYVAQGKEPALDAEHWLALDASQSPYDLVLKLPQENASYRFRAWVRHARARMRAVFEYTHGRDVEVAYMFPSGRVTSDGWVELESNAVSVTGRDLSAAYLRVEGSGLSLDAVEVVAEGTYDAGGSCFGAFDPICGPNAVCIAEQCRQGDRYVPPLPPPEHRQTVAAYLSARIRYFFGGRFSRLNYMPAALAELEKMRHAETAWQFWSALGRGISLLDDWHTGAGSAIQIHGSPRRLAVCFIEGHADLSQSAWPSQANRSDVLVSHVGPEQNLGLHPGDRLVLVDGQHPIDWARSLIAVQWGHHRATDPDVDAELVESMRNLIPVYAKTFGVVRCDPKTLVCSDQIETIDVRSLASADVLQPSCDNRPGYHLANPPEAFPGSITTYHQLSFLPWRERVAESPPGEDIYGMTWDSLYGTDQGLTPYLLETNQFFKDNARGVILDHRAGSGGTRDAPQAITQLVRTPQALSVGPVFMMTAADDGPATQAEGVERFTALSKIANQVYQVGSDNPDLALPVALLLHRDGSASDWLPHGMKGAPNVRIFAPHETAGAFSSFYTFEYWSRLEFNIASGDTITYDGQTLIGSGIEPDEIVEHTQSALLEGRDLPFEAALAWVRKNLK